MRAFVIALLLLTNSAWAISPDEIAALKAQSKNQAALESARDHYERIHLIHEIDLLSLMLKAKEHSMKTDRTIERVAVVISAGLAAYLGYTVFKPTATGTFGNAKLIDFGERAVIGTITSFGVMTTLSTRGVAGYFINVNPQQISMLDAKLLAARAHLTAAEEK